MKNPSAYLLDNTLRIFESCPTPSTLIHLAANWKGIHNIASPGVVRDFQWRRLRRMIRYAVERSPFYGERFAALGLTPQDIRTIEDFSHLPLTTVQDLRIWQKFIAVPEHRHSSAFTTSGTTGETKRVYYTARELNALSNVGVIGLRLRIPGRLVALIALPPGLWIGTSEAI